MTEKEKLLKAKIPCAETGIEVKKEHLRYLQPHLPLRSGCLCKGWGSHQD